MVNGNQFYHDLPCLVVEVCESVEPVGAEAGVDVVNVVLAVAGPAWKERWNEQRRPM